MKRALPFFVLLCFLTSLRGTAAFCDFYGKVETGLLALKKKFPYHLFVPKEYSPEKSWPLAIVLLGGATEEDRDIQPWIEWARQHQLLALFPSVLPKEGTMSNETVDRWILRLKKEVLERYQISSSDILLIGTELGAHYSAYLGLNYPEEFSAAALLRRSWVGPFEKLMKTSSNRRRQIGFYVAVDPKDALFPAMEKKALELEKKGYPIQIEALGVGEDLARTRERVLQWFQENREYRAVRVARGGKTGLKGKLVEMRKNMFGV